MIITDEEIKKQGINSITFKVEEHAPAITVWLEAGNYKFFFILDEKLEMKATDRKDLKVLFLERGFIEHLILSHLKELLCSDRILSGEPGLPGESAVEREKEFKGRRPHLRKLPAGQGYSLEAQNLALADPRRYDLARINAELGFTKETGQKTYVRVSIQPLPGEEPLVSRARHATDRLGEILAKAAPKTEE